MEDEDGNVGARTSLAGRNDGYAASFSCFVSTYFFKVDILTFAVGIDFPFLPRSIFSLGISTSDLRLLIGLLPRPMSNLTNELPNPDDWIQGEENDDYDKGEEASEE